MRISNSQLPSEWRMVSIEKIANKVTDGEHITPERSESGILLLSARNVQNGYLSLKDVDYIPEHEYQRIIKRCHPEYGDVLISCSGTIGRVCIVPQNIRFTLVRSAALIKPSDKINASFLSNVLRSNFVQNQILRALNQSAQANLFINHINSLVIPLPPLLEQCRIAEVLGVWDESIDLLERLIGRVRSRKQGLMQQLLTGKKRFKEFESSEWKKIKIRKLMVESRIHGLTGLDARKITVKLYCKGVFAKDEKRVGSENTNYFKRKSGQFIYSKLDFLNGAFGIVPNELDGYESTLDLPCFDFTEYAIPKFIFYFVGREEFYSRFADQAIGGRKARRVSPEEFLSTEIKIPSLPEQEKIAAVLSAADEEISTLEKQLAAYKQQKLGLMQQLLTGRIRI
jgi:type I restriction enzyme, S subunit